MKTIELGKPENLEKLNFLVGKIMGRNVHIDRDGECFEEGADEHGEWVNRYHPSTNVMQCFDATPLCDIHLAFGVIDNKVYYATKIATKEQNKYLWANSESELIARCLALIYSKYGEEVQDELFNA